MGPQKQHTLGNITEYISHGYFIKCWDVNAAFTPVFSVRKDTCLQMLKQKESLVLNIILALVHQDQESN